MRPRRQSREPRHEASRLFPRDLNGKKAEGVSFWLRAPQTTQVLPPLGPTTSTQKAGPAWVPLSTWQRVKVAPKGSEATPEPRLTWGPQHCHCPSTTQQVGLRQPRQAFSWEPGCVAPGPEPWAVYKGTEGITDAMRIMFAASSVRVQRAVPVLSARVGGSCPKPM